MRAKFYVTFFGAMLIGLVAGYGAVSIFGLFFEKTNWPHWLESFTTANAVSSIDYSIDSGEGPEPEIKYIQKEKQTFLNKEISYTTKKVGFNIIDGNQKFPVPKSKAFLVADLESGNFLEFDQKEKVLPIASLSKLMTALIVFNETTSKEKIYISKSAVGAYGKQGNLSAGEEIEQNHLLRALLLESSNDAAEAFSEHDGRYSFLEKMNEEAKRLGMKKTFYDDPSGLSFKNVSTAEDLFILTRYIFQNFPEILEITKEKSYKIPGHLWHNNSSFRNDDNYIGGKNGYTDEARETLISLFNLPIGENDDYRKVAIIILGSEDAKVDTRNILLYLLMNVEYVES